MVEAYADLARRVWAGPARLGRTRLVVVDGPSGAGKSVFADRLADALAETAADVATARPSAHRTDETRPPVVRTDDLLDGWADQFTFWARLEARVLAPLRAGRPGGYQRYCWQQRRFLPDLVPVPVAPVLVVEGVSSARRVIRPEATLSVFVTAPAEPRLARAVARDGAEILPELRRWHAAEQRHFAADGTATAVDLVVDGAPTLPHDPQRCYVRRLPHPTDMAAAERPVRRTSP